MVPIPFVHIGVGVLTVVTALPLALGRVAPNPAYGFRFRKAFASEANWYRINRTGGVMLIAFGAGLVLFGWLAGPFAPPPRSILAPLFLAAPLTLLAPLALVLKWVADQLPD